MLGRPPSLTLFPDATFFRSPARPRARGPPVWTRKGPARPRRENAPAPIGRRRSDGTSSARNPAKLSDVTSPHATSSPSPFSTSVRSRPVALTRSPKNDAPRSSRTPSTAPAGRDNAPSAVSGGPDKDRHL